MSELTTGAGQGATVLAYLVLICAAVDAIVPVPRPGSRWVRLRELISWVALNKGYALNRILPGSLETTVTPLDVMRLVEQTHTEANVSRAVLSDQIAAASFGKLP